MLVEYLKSKIHKATITQADLDYVGSLTIDAELMKAAKLLPGEKIAAFNFQNGSRFETYVIKGEPNSGIIGLNGPATHLGTVGHQIIIVSYALMTPNQAKKYNPTIVHVDDNNKVV